MLENFKAFQIAKQLHFACKNTKVSWLLENQLLRASSSVVLNLAEGSGKRTPSEQRRFYSIAMGSLRECQAILALEEVKDAHLADLANQLGAILFRLTHPKIKQRQTENCATRNTGNKLV